MLRGLFPLLVLNRTLDVVNLNLAIVAEWKVWLRSFGWGDQLAILRDWLCTHAAMPLYK